jgi:hypothetical protein
MYMVERNGSPHWFLTTTARTATVPFFLCWGTQKPSLIMNGIPETNTVQQANSPRYGLVVLDFVRMEIDIKGWHFPISE